MGAGATATGLRSAPSGVLMRFSAIGVDQSIDKLR
jgi:hypothetical protein